MTDKLVSLRGYKHEKQEKAFEIRKEKLRKRLVKELDSALNFREDIVLVRYSEHQLRAVGNLNGAELVGVLKAASDMSSEALRGSNEVSGD